VSQKKKLCQVSKCWGVTEPTKVARVVEIINLWEILEDMTDGKGELYLTVRGQYEIKS